MGLGVSDSGRDVKATILSASNDDLEETFGEEAMRFSFF